MSDPNRNRHYEHTPQSDKSAVYMRNIKLLLGSQLAARYCQRPSVNCLAMAELGRLAEICQRHIVEGMDGKINPGLLRRNVICLCAYIGTIPGKREGCKQDFSLMRWPLVQVHGRGGAQARRLNGKALGVRWE